MPSRAQIEAVIPAASEVVYRETGIYPKGFGITGKNGELALSITLHEKPVRPPPETILGVPAVFQIVAAPVFLSQRRKAAAAAERE
jgi:hypothetical protein